MTSYAVSGTLTPDATTANTGEPAGTYNEQNYWTWTNEAGTWYLWWQIGKSQGSVISHSLGDDILLRWKATGLVPHPAVGFTHQPLSGASGTATVAEYVPPSSDPVLRGNLFLLISHVNGVELASPKKITLAEFDE